MPPQKTAAMTYAFSSVFILLLSFYGVKPVVCVCVSVGHTPFLSLKPYFTLLLHLSPAGGEGEEGSSSKNITLPDQLPTRYTHTLYT